MPKPRPATAGDRLQPVPVGLFLARTHQRRQDVSDWHGLSPYHLAHLIRRYTRTGDVVLDLDTHPAAVAATSYLQRVPARLAAGRHGPHVRHLTTPDQPATGRPGAGIDLILATLPAAPAHPTFDTTSTTMRAWQPLLRPGGYLIVALTTTTPQPGEASLRTTVIAAARTAGFFYHQHIPAVLVPLPAHEPRTAPEQPDETDDGRRLLAGRHLPIFRDLLVFATTATSEDNARA